MVHIHYYRAERNRIDNVVLLLPDTSSNASLMPPTEEAFKQIEETLKDQLAQKLAAIDAEQLPELNSAASTTNGNADSNLQSGKVNGITNDANNSKTSEGDNEPDSNNANAAQAAESSQATEEVW